SGLADQETKTTAAVSRTVQRVEEPVHRLGSTDEWIGPTRSAKERGASVEPEAQHLRRAWPRAAGRRLRHLRGEAIASPPHRLNWVLRLGALAQGLSGAADGPRNRGVVYVLARPEGLEELLFAYDPVVVFDEIANRVEHFGLERHLRAVAPQLVA